VAEIRIVGNGPVALTCALLLARHWPEPDRILLDAANDPSPGLAQRPLALSVGSHRLLERVAAAPTPAAGIRTVEVALQGRYGRVRMPASDLHADVLGYVVRYQNLLATLESALAQSGVQRVPAGFQERSAVVTIQAGGDPGPHAATRTFGQAALTAETRVQGLAPGTALERFTRQGPLALLPLPEPSRWALVWCAPEALTRERLTMEPERRLHALNVALGSNLSVSAIDDCAVIPLVRRTREPLVQRGAGGVQVWIGNAAQTLHPVAGQGLNLGLRDADQLTQALLHWRIQGEGDAEQALLRYTGLRRRDRSITVALTDGLAEVFTWPLLAPAQSLVMTLLDRSPLLRRGVARRFALGSA